MNEIKPVTKEVYLVANLNSHDNTFHLSIDMWKPSNSARAILLETFSITKETSFSHDQLTQMQLAKLDVVDEANRATHYMDVKENDEIRQSLLAITHQPEVVEISQVQYDENNTPLEGDNDLLEEAVDAVFDVPEAANDAEFEEVEE